MIGPATVSQTQRLAASAGARPQATAMQCAWRLETDDGEGLLATRAGFACVLPLTPRTTK